MYYILFPPVKTFCVTISAMIEQVKDTNGGNANKETLQKKESQQLSIDLGPPKRWPIVLTGLLLSGVSIGGVYVIVSIASVFDEVTAIATFIAGSTVGLFTLLAIIAQAAIYWQQRNFMMRHWNAMQESVSRTDVIIEKMQGQLEVMHDALDHDRQRALEDAADRIKQLQIMKDQAKTMDRSLVLGTRAYVGVHSITFDTARRLILFQVENIGRVPAKDIQVALEITIRMREHFMPTPLPKFPGGGWSYHPGTRSRTLGVTLLPGEWQLQIPWSHPYGRTKLFPGSLRIGIVIHLDDIPNLNPGHIAEMITGNARTSLSGVITYSDGFHRGKKTEFDFQYFSKGDIWIARSVTGVEFQGDGEQPDSDYSPS